MKNKLVIFFVILGIMFIGSLLLLLLLSAIIWKTDGTSALLSGGIIFIYVLINILGGFLAGKSMGQQKFFWGLLVGGVYFAVLLLAGVAFAETPVSGNTQLVSGAFVCVISGMLGGMLAPGQKAEGRAH
ncbi:MAG: TIGR04086 family membrane protein [Clostridiaceae bacterium]|nr:TIGR04086 family membrane protein [Clostridiaceae bacterium]